MRELRSLLLVAALTVVALRREATPASEPSAAPAAPSSVDSRTIAVLPFRAATPGEANEELALVVTDVLRNRLASIDGVISIATGSITHLPDPDPDAREMGRTLNARLVLEGSTARSGDHITNRFCTDPWEHLVLESLQYAIRMMRLPFALESGVPRKRDGLQRVRVGIDESRSALFASGGRIAFACNEFRISMLFSRASERRGLLSGRDPCNENFGGDG